MGKYNVNGSLCDSWYFIVTISRGRVPVSLPPSIMTFLVVA